MASFASLTPTQQKTITDFSTQLRGYVADLAKVMDSLTAINDSYLGNAGPVLNLLTAPDNGIAITDNTGLAGAVPLTPYQMGLIMNQIQAVLATDTDANRQVWVLACGPENLVS